MKKIYDARRIKKINDHCVFACSGEMADAQELEKQLEKKCEHDELEQDGACFLQPRHYFNWIGLMNYHRRLKANPLWLATVVAGWEGDKAFLGNVDLYGLKIEADFVLTGLALHYCQVLMQNEWRADMTEMEAKQLLAKCQTVLFYRVKACGDRLTFSVITKDGVKMDEPVQVDSNWHLDFYRTQTNEVFRPLRCINH